MLDASITATLSQAGMRLLKTLIDRAQEYGEATDLPNYVIIEHLAQGALDLATLESALEAAQSEFRRCAGVHERWLEAFAELLEYGGDQTARFAEILWCAYLFRLESAADMLWDLYPELQRNIIIETGHTLPRSWGDWILPLQTFMDTFEKHLIDRNPVFEELFALEELDSLLDSLTTVAPAPAGTPISDAGAIPGDQYKEIAALNTYLTLCCEEIGHIDPRGYPRSINRTVPLSDVYVPVRLVPLNAGRKPDHYARYQTATYDSPELYTFRDPLGYQELEAHQGLTVQDVLSRHAQVLILGDNGAGKTTLLRHLTLEHARILLDDDQDSWRMETWPDGSLHFKLVRPLPIYVDLADYIESHELDENLEDFILRSMANMARDDGIKSLLASLIKNGQCLILLDGLDQVCTDEQRRMLVAVVAQSAVNWRAAGNRIVVTSRLSGYSTAPLPPEFAGYVLRPLDRSQIGSFLLKWKLTLARMKRPLMRDEEALRQAHSETLALVRQVTANSRFYALANTPLLLRMLVSVHRPGMILPAQRAAIYQLVAETLIREWHLPQGAASRPAVLEHEVTPLLGELAYWLQSSRPSGMLSEQELRDILGHSWSRMHPEMSAEQTHAAISDFLGRLRLHAGVLIELAPQRYGFIYHGLQEYFAARHLVSSYRLAAERIRDHLHDPRWDEVIMLGISLTSLGSCENASDLIEVAILARGARAAQFGHMSSPFEALLKRDLFFAARLLGNGVETCPEVTQEIVRELMRLWLEGDRDDLGRFNLIFDSARRHLVNLEGTPGSQYAFQIALENLANRDEHCQAFAADALTFWPAYLPDARAALVHRGREASPLVRRAVAQALGQAGSLSKEAYSLLLAYTRDADEQVCEISQQVLEGAAPIPHEALAMWVDFLHSDTPAKRRLGLRVLQQAGSLPPMVIGELLHLLDDPDSSIREGAIEALAGISNLPDNALTAICRIISDPNVTVRVAAIHALCRPVELPEEVITQLVRWTHETDASVRHAATKALGVCRNRTPEVIEALIERLGDPADSVREIAIEPLAAKGADDPQVAHMLLHMVRDPIDRVRCAVASAFRHFPDPEPEMRQALETLLSDGEMSVREATLETIAQLNNPGPEIINYLISLFPVQEHGIGSKAVQTLAALRGLPEHALLALAKALQVHWEHLGEQITACLQAHLPLSGEVINEIMDLAVLRSVGSRQTTRVPARLRALALEVLGYALEETPAALRVLLEATDDQESTEIQIAALHGLARARVMWPSIKQILAQFIERGPLEVRCAAGIALGTLIRNLPDPPLSSEEMLKTARSLAELLSELPPRASWESDTKLQNEVLLALSWVVARARPTLPRLAAGSE